MLQRGSRPSSAWTGTGTEGLHTVQFLRARGLAREAQGGIGLGIGPTFPGQPNRLRSPPPPGTKTGLSLTLATTFPSESAVVSTADPVQALGIAFNNAVWGRASNAGEYWVAYQGDDGTVRVAHLAEGGGAWDATWFEGATAGRLSSGLPTAKPAITVVGGAATSRDGEPQNRAVVAWFDASGDIVIGEYVSLYGGAVTSTMEYLLSNTAGGTEPPSLTICGTDTGVVYVAWAQGGQVQWVRSDRPGDWTSLTTHTITHENPDTGVDYICEFPTLACCSWRSYQAFGRTNYVGPQVLLAWKWREGANDGNIAYVAGSVHEEDGDPLEGALPASLTAYTDPGGAVARDPAAWASPGGVFFVGYDVVEDDPDDPTRRRANIHVTSTSDPLAGFVDPAVVVSTTHRGWRPEDAGLEWSNFVSGSATDEVAMVVWEEGPSVGEGASEPFSREVYAAVARVSDPAVWDQYGTATDGSDAGLLPASELAPGDEQAQFPCVQLRRSVSARGRGGARDVATTSFHLFWVKGQGVSRDTWYDAGAIRLLTGTIDGI